MNLIYVHKNKLISSKSGLGLGTFIGKTLLERMKANVKFDKCPSKLNGAMVTIRMANKRFTCYLDFLNSKE